MNTSSEPTARMAFDWAKKAKGDDRTAMLRTAMQAAPHPLKVTILDWIVNETDNTFEDGLIDAVADPAWLPDPLDAQIVFDLLGASGESPTPPDDQREYAAAQLLRNQPDLLNDSDPPRLFEKVVLECGLTRYVDEYVELEEAASTMPHRAAQGAWYDPELAQRVMGDIDAEADPKQLVSFFGHYVNAGLNGPTFDGKILVNPLRRAPSTDRVMRTLIQEGLPERTEHDLAAFVDEAPVARNRFVAMVMLHRPDEGVDFARPIDREMGKEPDFRKQELNRLYKALSTPEYHETKTDVIGYLAERRLVPEPEVLNTALGKSNKNADYMSTQLPDRVQKSANILSD